MIFSCIIKLVGWISCIYIKQRKQLLNEYAIKYIFINIDRNIKHHKYVQSMQHIISHFFVELTSTAN